MILGERPEARLLDFRFAKPNQSEVVKRAPDAPAPELRHHIEGLQDAVAHRDHPDGLAVLERDERLPAWVGERRDPVGANRVIGERVHVRWEDVLEAGDRRRPRDPEAQLGVLHRGAHDSHVRRTYYAGRDPRIPRSGGAARPLPVWRVSLGMNRGAKERTPRPCGPPEASRPALDSGAPAGLGHLDEPRLFSASATLAGELG